ncbi:hypothetical protein K5X82_01640 [Halosquirtibacter xylanolyticus]|uniref:hypothetical protein n=1 Tax=Halosquirtibacter xylanolyticus TaxID=3374599 RepID=UPI0037491126|nr:hypothetical protein K5X82_01640 [Prolixibacteraceae bacterium]
MKKLIVFFILSISTSICIKAQEQESFWYKDSKYIHYLDDELEIIFYANKMIDPNRGQIIGTNRGQIIFHFNIYNRTNRPLLIKPTDIWIYEGIGKRVETYENRKWQLIELISPNYFYRHYYGPQSNYQYTNEDLSMNHNLHSHYETEQVNDSTKRQVLVTEYIAQNKPNKYEVHNHLYMSTRYIGKTTLTKSRHASGLLISLQNHREVPEQIKMVIKMSGTAQRVIYYNQD